MKQASILLGIFIASFAVWEPAAEPASRAEIDSISSAVDALSDGELKQLRKTVLRKGSGDPNAYDSPSRKIEDLAGRVRQLTVKELEQVIHHVNHSPQSPRNLERKRQNEAKLVAEPVVDSKGIPAQIEFKPREKK